MMLEYWIVVIGSVVVLSLIIFALTIWKRRRKEKILEFFNFCNTDFYVLSNTFSFSRKSYAKLVSHKIEKGIFLVQYYTITYDSFFRRYELSDLITTDTFENFKSNYMKATHMVDYYDSKEVLRLFSENGNRKIGNCKIE